MRSVANPCVPPVPTRIGRGVRDTIAFPPMRAAARASRQPDDLSRFGYAQELFRSMGGFSNFAISFSIISILTGPVTLYGYGLEMVGPLEMTPGWPIATVF